MENNQQKNSARNASNTNATSFSNSQPGQQSPVDNETGDPNRVIESNDNIEQHSDTSQPAHDNETLGTP